MSPLIVIHGRRQIGTNARTPGALAVSLRAPTRRSTARTWERRSSVGATSATDLTDIALAMKQAKYLPRILTNRVIDPNLEDLRELALNCAPPDVQRRALAAMVPDSGRAGREMSLTGVPVDRTKIRCPMMVVAAERDRFIPASVVARIARRYNAPLKTIPGHGHMVVMEPGWETLAHEIATWIGTF